MTLVTPVILCGGNGTRLWPRSRATYPKPFLPLIGEETLFEATLSRCSDRALFAQPLIVAGSAHLSLIEAQLGQAPKASIIVEPEAKNTAPAIALAALRLSRETIMLVCPSDHYICDLESFMASVRAAASLAAAGWLVSFGIEATAPETGFGYLKLGVAIGTNGFEVAKFVEKPDADRAKSFLAEGGYAWNGGIFAFRAGDYLDELEAHRPDMATAAHAAVEGGHMEGLRFHPNPVSFGAISGESIDYAVMESTKCAAMVSASIGWSDIGNWQALHAARRHDAQGNSVTGNADLIECQNVLVETDGPRVSVIGLEGVMIVIDNGEVLVTTAAGAQMVGKLPGAVNQ